MISLIKLLRKYFNIFRRWHLFIFNRKEYNRIKKSMEVVSQAKEQLNKKIDALREYAIKNRLVTCCLCKVGSGTLMKFPMDDKLYCHALCYNHYIDILRTESKNKGGEKDAERKRETKGKPAA